MVREKGGQGRVGEGWYQVLVGKKWSLISYESQNRWDRSRIIVVLTWFEELKRLEQWSDFASHWSPTQVPNVS